MSFTKGCSACFCCLSLLGTAPAQAQERESVLETIIDRAGQRLIVLLDRPLHPFLSSVAPGGGLGAGLAYQSRRTTPWKLEAAGAMTLRRFLAAQFATHFQTSDFHFSAAARARDLAALNFYGVGETALQSPHAVYSLQDRAIGVRAAHRSTSWLTITAAYEVLWPDVGRGRSDDALPVHDRFTEQDAPGLTLQPRYARYAAVAHVDAPAANAIAVNQGGDIRLAWQHFDDRNLAAYSFSRIDVQARHRFTVGGPFRRLTLHGLVSTTNTSGGNAVPFYLLPSLGGHGLTLDVPGSPIGDLDTRFTLRGYPTYRFRDRHLMMLQAEYKYPIWGPIDAIAFVDAGKVASSRRDLDLTDLKSDAGVGLSVMSSPNNAAHLFLAFGAEGTRVSLSIGQLILP